MPREADIGGCPPGERRAAKRVDVAFSLSFQFGTQPGAPPSLGTVTDLSTTGLFVHTPRFLEPPTRFAGVLRDDAEQSSEHGVHFVGEVTWRQPSGLEPCRPRPSRTDPSSLDASAGPEPKGPGFGVRFVQMTLADHVAIRKLVAQAAQRRRPGNRRPRLRIH